MPCKLLPKKPWIKDRHCITDTAQTHFIINTVQNTPWITVTSGKIYVPMVTIFTKVLLFFFLSQLLIDQSVYKCTIIQSIVSLASLCLVGTCMFRALFIPEGMKLVDKTNTYVFATSCNNEQLWFPSHALVHYNRWSAFTRIVVELVILSFIVPT